MDYKKYIAEKLNIDGVTIDELYSLIILPPDTTLGDFALPCFKFAKTLRKAPQMIAEDFKNSFTTDEVISKVTAVNGYLNFTVNRGDLVSNVIDKVLKEGENYGSSDLGNGKTVVIDYSSINIAKPFHIGHLSTTVIGGALYRMYKY